MLKKMAILAFFVFSSISTPVMAGDVDGRSVLGGAIGGATGAAIGSAVGGKEGAMIGAGVGGVAGVAVATPDRRERRPVYVNGQMVYVYEDGGPHGGPHRYRKGHGHD